jgi:serine protease
LGGGIPDADIDAPEAWDLTTGSHDVVVAVVDSGVDYTHEDLSANMFQNPGDCDANGLDDDGNGYADDCHGIDAFDSDSDPMDENGHGTHVAGIIGAVGNNGVGIAGVNWSTQILACKAGDSSNNLSIYAVNECLQYVADMKDLGANIVAVNYSAGGSSPNEERAALIDVLREKGILFVAAAGNEAADNDVTPHFPSNNFLPNIIAVAATNRFDLVPTFSNYGLHTVHVGAPGDEILSTWWDGADHQRVRCHGRFFPDQ